MPNDNHEIIEVIDTQPVVDIKDEAKKQFSIAARESLKCCKKPAKDFSASVIDYCINRAINWLGEKFSA